MLCNSLEQTRRRVPIEKLCRRGLWTISVHSGSRIQNGALPRTNAHGNMQATAAPVKNLNTASMMGVVEKEQATPKTVVMAIPIMRHFLRPMLWIKEAEMHYTKCIIVYYWFTCLLNICSNWVTRSALMIRTLILYLIILQYILSWLFSLAIVSVFLNLIASYTQKLISRLLKQYIVCLRACLPRLLLRGAFSKRLMLVADSQPFRWC